MKRQKNTRQNTQGNLSPSQLRQTNLDFSGESAKNKHFVPAGGVQTEVDREEAGDGVAAQSHRLWVGERPARHGGGGGGGAGAADGALPPEHQHAAGRQGDEHRVAVTADVAHSGGHHDAAQLLGRLRFCCRV